MLIASIYIFSPSEEFGVDGIKEWLDPRQHDIGKTKHADDYWKKTNIPKLELVVPTGHEGYANKVPDKKNFQSFPLLVVSVDAKFCCVLAVKRFRKILQASRRAILFDKEVVNV